ncbi:hypothetical protein ElyMa_003758200 [Elysia marginata]|uniref:Uncharacterized protein n=1 Tax=Elysia marginata TaxID=1093978 RepID=A0AAV4F9H2_9GAST|nr:hypothetical protein ElyMa_003758200 [Elysia marginata]
MPSTAQKPMCSSHRTVPQNHVRWKHLVAAIADNVKKGSYEAPNHHYQSINNAIKVFITVEGSGLPVCGSTPRLVRLAPMKHLLFL